MKTRQLKSISRHGVSLCVQYFDDYRSTRPSCLPVTTVSLHIVFILFPNLLVYHHLFPKHLFITFYTFLYRRPSTHVYPSFYLFLLCLTTIFPKFNYLFTRVLFSKFTSAFIAVILSENYHSLSISASLSLLFSISTTHFYYTNVCLHL